jgi:hypothetical protein
MSRANDKDVENAAPPASEPAGKVEFDSRGNSVWRWARDVLENTSVLLKRLEVKDLALEPTQKVPVMRGAGAAPSTKSAATAKPTETKPVARHPFAKKSQPRDGGGGFDPYNSR